MNPQDITQPKITPGALPDNQVHTIFNNALSRDATPHELTTYAPASIQTLANLKDTYAKLNPNSITDYLKSIGQDSSLANRQALGAKYGITNIGTAEGNTALLNALKSGKAPETANVGGSITSVTPPTDTTSPATATDTGIGGSVADAATSSDTTQTDQPPVLPEVKTTNDAYVQTQTAVNDVTKRINDINTSIDSAMQNKRDEIARSGGVVDESQLRSLVLTENAPLLAERKDLLSQRTQLVGEQNIAGKAYQDAINNQKQSDANFFKAQTVNQNQQKIDETALKNANAEQIATAKLEQAGYKPQKVNIKDSAGNILGQKIITWVNPANKNLGVTSDGTSVAISTDKAGNTTATPIGNNSLPTVDKTTTPPKGITIANGYSPTQVYQALISGPNKSVKGIVGGVDQETLYNAAIDLMMGVASTQGARIPAAAAFSVQQKKTEIMNAYGLNEVDINIAKTQFKNLSATNATLLQRSSLTNLSANIAKDNLDLAVKASDKVPRTGAKLVNNYQQWLKGNFTPAGNLAELETYIYTYVREYAKVTSGAAASIAGLTDSAQSEVEKLLNAAQSPEVFKQVATAMNNDMQNVIDENTKAVSSFPETITKLYGFAQGASYNPAGTSKDITQYTPIKFDIPQNYDYNYDRDYQQATQAIQSGNDPATVWGHFNSLYK